MYSQEKAADNKGRESAGVDDHSDVIFLANNAVMDHKSNYVGGVPSGHNDTEDLEKKERNEYY